jgi:hypothetical protein
MYALCIGAFATAGFCKLSPGLLFADVLAQTGADRWLKVGVLIGLAHAWVLLACCSVRHWVVVALGKLQFAALQCVRFDCA